MKVWRLTIPGFLLILLSAFAAKGQNGGMHDRTLEELGVQFKTSGPDTQSVRDLCRAADKLWFTAPDSGITLARQALKLSRKIGFKRGIISSLLSIGVCEMQKGNHAESIRSLRNALDYCLYPAPDISPAIRALADLGITYYNLGNFDSSAFYYYNAIELSKKSGQEFTINTVNTYNNLAVLWMHNKDQNKAFNYLLKGEEIATIKKFYDVLPTLIAMKSAVSHAKGNDSAALRYGSVAAALARRYHQPHILMTALLNMADVLIEHKQGNEAVRFVLEAMEAGKGMRISYAQANPHFFLGKAYHQLKRYKAAEAELQIFLKGTDSFHMVENRLDAFQLLANIDSATGQYQKAYRHIKSYVALSEDLSLKEKERVIQQLEVRYQTLEKDKEISGQQALIARQDGKLKEKNFWISCGLLGSLLLGTLSLGLYRNYLNKQRLQSVALRAMQQEQEIAQLKAKINGEESERTRIARELHDGIMVQFAAVKMNLSALIRRHSHKEGIDEFKEPVLLLDNATRELRRTAHNLMPDMLLEEGLAEAVYFFCRNLQQSVSTTINFQSYGQVPRLAVDFELAVYRIIQELVHNVIKHAQAAEALIQISFQQDLLMVTVEDDGTGIPEHLIKGDSMGLKSVRNRVAELKGQIVIHGGPMAGTVVYIEFDINHLTDQKPHHANKAGYHR